MKRICIALCALALIAAPAFAQRIVARRGSNVVIGAPAVASAAVGGHRAQATVGYAGVGVGVGIGAAHATVGYGGVGAAPVLRAPGCAGSYPVSRAFSYSYGYSAPAAAFNYSYAVPAPTYVAPAPTYAAPASTCVCPAPAALPPQQRNVEEVTTYRRYTEVQ